MTRGTTRLIILLTLVAAAVGAGTANAKNQRSALKEKQVLGTWAAQIVIPPNPLIGNTEEVIMFEYITFSKNGGLVATANFPLFPVPVGDKIRSAIVSVSHSSWRIRNGMIQGTNWRFLNSKKTGQFWGFMKNRVEFRPVDKNRMEGRWFLELFTPALTPIQFAGAPAVLGPGVVHAVKVPVETIQ